MKARLLTMIDDTTPGIEPAKRQETVLGERDEDMHKLINAIWTETTYPRQIQPKTDIARLKAEMAGKPKGIDITNQPKSSIELRKVQQELPHIYSVIEELLGRRIELPLVTEMGEIGSHASSSGQGAVPSAFAPISEQPAPNSVSGIQSYGKVDPPPSSQQPNRPGASRY